MLKMFSQQNDRTYDHDHPNIVRCTEPFTPENYPNVSVSEYISSRIACHSANAIALIDPETNEHFSFSYLNIRIHQLAAGLLNIENCKLKPTDFVIFFADNSLQYCSLLLATVYLGLPYCPVPPSSGAFELTEQIRGTNGTILVIGCSKISTLKKVLENEPYSQIIFQYISTIVLMDVEKGNSFVELFIKTHPVTKSKTITSFSKIESVGTGHKLHTIPHFPIADPSKSPYIICFTSGTTGPSKAAVHSHRSFLCNLLNTKVGLGTADELFGSRGALFWPLGHISGSTTMPHMLDIGMTVVLFKDSDLEKIITKVSKFKINHLFFSAHQARPLAISDYESRFDLSSLISFKTCGARIPDSLMLEVKRKYHVKMFEMYGCTEMQSAVRVRDPIDTELDFVPGNVGRVVSGVEMAILDLETGKPLSKGEKGEVCFKGDGVFAGYLNNLEATQKTIISGWLHSGDVGYYDHQGRLFICDRIKELIKYQQYSIVPAEIEDFILKNKSVAAVCVVGVPHHTEGSYLRAYVEKVCGVEITEEELSSYVEKNMGTQKRLRAGVHFIESMPRTLIGKVDRQHFKRLVAGEMITEVIE